jgi:hypothetical protein
MKKRIIYKAFVYILCISFLLLMNGFPTMVANAKEKSLPIGEMVSGGEVKFEARENVWKDVEQSNFPIFQGVKIKTGKGTAIIALTNNSQIEVGQNSILFFDPSDCLHLSQGSLNFRIPYTAEINFKVGNLFFTKTRSLQASKDLSAGSSKNEEIIGSILIHSNGSVTIKNIQGQLSILDQNHVVLAGLSSQDSITIPSTTVKGTSKVMVAQAGEAGGAGAETGGFAGISTLGWVGIVCVLGAAGVGLGIAASHGGGGGVTCP